MGMKADKVIKAGEDLLGLEYDYGGNSTVTGMDCSHFVSYCLTFGGYPGIGPGFFATTEYMDDALLSKGWIKVIPGETFPRWKKGDVVLRGTSGKNGHVGLVYDKDGHYQIDSGGATNVVNLPGLKPGNAHGVAVRGMSDWVTNNGRQYRYPNDPDIVYPISWIPAPGDPA